MENESPVKPAEELKMDKVKEREQLLETMKKQKEIIVKSSKIENDSKKKKKEKKRKRSFSSERLSPKYDASLERPRNDSVTTEMDVRNAPQAENGFTERHEEIIRQSKSDIK